MFKLKGLVSCPKFKISLFLKIPSLILIFHDVYWLIIAFRKVLSSLNCAKIKFDSDCDFEHCDTSKFIFRQAHEQTVRLAFWK